MKRRTFLQGLGSAAVILAAPSWSQDRRIPLIGFIAGLSETDRPYIRPSIQRGLSVAGLVDGENVNVVYRWTGGDHGLMNGLIRELVELDARAIICDGSQVSRTAKAITDRIPLIFLTGGDPVKMGFVESLHAPGGQMTGYLLVNTELTAKRTVLLLELLPDTKTIALLGNNTNRSFEIHRNEFRRAMQASGHTGRIFKADNEDNITAAYTELATLPQPALVVQGDQFFDSRRDLLLDLAARFAIPAIYPWREYPDNGGLISYGVSFEDAYSALGELAAQIVTGHPVSELPVRVAKSFEMVINRQTAQTLGIELADSILLRADELIE